MKLRKKLVHGATALAALVSAGADDFGFNNYYEGGSGISSSPVVTTSIVADPTYSNAIDLTLTASSFSKNTYCSTLDFNISNSLFKNGYINGLSYSVKAQTGSVSVQSVNSGNFNGGGEGYNLEIDFSNWNNNQFKQGCSITLVLSCNAGFKTSDFENANKDGYISGAHIQDGDQADSWVGCTTFTPVPEASTWAAVGFIGFVSVATLARRSMKRRE